MIHGLDVRPYAALVAEAPEDDAGMVEITLYQRLRPVHMCLLPCEVFAHLPIGIAVAVSLVVGLVHHIDAPAVADFVEILAVGIVRGAQEVDVCLFHQPDIIFVGGIIDVAACNGMMVVTVHTAQLHVLAIDLEDLADDLHPLHAEVIVEMLDDVALFILQFDAERIEVWLLGRPEQGFVDGAGEFNGCRITRSQQR